MTKLRSGLNIAARSIFLPVIIPLVLVRRIAAINADYAYEWERKATSWLRSFQSALDKRFPTKISKGDNQC